MYPLISKWFLKPGAELEALVELKKMALAVEKEEGYKKRE